MTYYVTGYYQGKSILKREDHLFFLKCEEAEAPTEKEQLEIFQIYTR